MHYDSKGYEREEMMGHYFNGIGNYFNRLEKAKERNPKIAREYESVLDELVEKQRFADTAFGWRGTVDHDGWVNFTRTVVAPIQDKVDLLRDQLYCKHPPVSVVPVGVAQYTGDGLNYDEHDQCLVCGAEGSFGINFGKVVHRKSIAANIAEMKI